MVDPDVAYRFAKGEAIRHLNGEMVKRNTPLDFAAVTDHAEYLGVAQLLTDANHPLYQKPVAAKFRSKDPKEGQEAYLELGRRDRGSAQARPRSDRSEGRRTDLEARPGVRRTAQCAGQVHHLHRVRVELDARQQQPASQRDLRRHGRAGAAVRASMESTRPEDLWAYVERARAAGSDVIAIPHNGNISNGLMFQTTDSDGKAFTREYAQRRLDMEPLQEIIQLKGASETAPSLASNDEFADFELYQFELGTGKKLPEHRTSFIREAYKSGLALGATLGVNPFKFGLVGASDSHNGTAAPEENNFSGGHGAMDKDPTARLTAKDPLADKTKFSASGLTGVWAEENTRESIFAALKRKETFGTSGTFIRARLFGGWNYAANLTESPDWVKKAYADGVPMGSDLPPKPGEATAPTFVVAATKDPRSGNLDRIQIVKGWLDAKGQAQEKIYDVALSDGRTVDPATGKAPPVGNTVDVKTASYTNDIGDAQLMAVWSDREFDPAVPAFYYARVIEIPTPRWTTFDAVKLGIPAPEPATLQERAWTSPIWYSP